LFLPFSLPLPLPSLVPAQIVGNVIEKTMCHPSAESFFINPAGALARMDASLIYAIIVGGAFVLFLLRHVHKLLLALLWSRKLLRFFRRHIFPALIKRNRALPTITRLNVLLQTIYWAGTIVCNFVGISGISEGSSRAGMLALVSLVPLLFSDRLSFAADILSLSHRTYLQIHKAIGIMAVLQLTAHIALEAIIDSFVLSRPRDFYGLIVSDIDPVNLL
jgi:hypothetical protein